MGDVHRLHAVGECLSTKEDLADWLRARADDIAAGIVGNVDRVILIVHNPDDGVSLRCQGPDSFRTHAVIGMLEVAKLAYIDDE